MLIKLVSQTKSQENRKRITQLTRNCGRLSRIALPITARIVTLAYDTLKRSNNNLLPDQPRVTEEREFTL
jgi:hypothetical protein